MKNLKKQFTIFIAFFSAIACGEPEVPVELFEVMKYGAYARKMSQTGKFDFFNISGSSVDLHVEYYDEAKGANIAEYDIDLEYVDLKTGGAKSKARTGLLTIPASAFVVNSDGYLSSDISLSFNGALAALGITAADIDGGSYFRYHMTITKKDGSVYSNENTGPNMKSSNAFRALFYLDVSIICPSDLVASFDASTVGWCGATGTYSGSWELAGADNLYKVSDGDFSYGAYFACYGGWTGKPLGTLKIQDACNVLSATGASQWSEVYMFNSVSVNASTTTLTLDWINDYGEAGVSGLTRNDGGTWPAGLN
jgi:hypothetical protein